MDQLRLITTTEMLRNFLDRYSEADSEAKELLRLLSPIFDEAQSEKIVTPMDWRQIPGTYFLPRAD